MESKELLSTNQIYDDNAARWEFYLRSYMGGQEYADGAYLTRYINEDDKEYQKRLASTPCDNHCKNIVQIYNSFIWRVPPSRALPEDQVIVDFMKDADLDGRSFNAFMREAGAWASVYGHCWIVVDKPASIAETRQDEIEQGLRPYLTLITPDSVLDWRYERTVSGRYKLTMLKVRESVESDTTVVRIWEEDTVTVYKDDGKKVSMIEQMGNPLGRIPAVTLYASRSTVRGIGVSDISDVADFQKAIYSELSEIEQLIRISNHPSLALTESTDASAGAGGLVTMPDELESGLKPFLLQPSSGSLTGVMESIDAKTESINRIAHMGGVRATETKAKSGVALQTEFQLLNARLSEKADLLELAEEQIWELFSEWQGQDFEIEIDYPDTFDVRDYAADLEFYQMAKASGIQSQLFSKEVSKKIAALIAGDEELQAIVNEIDQGAAFTEPE